MKVLKNGGYFISCSCSRFMETANFEKMFREAASEAGVILKQVSVTQQNEIILFFGQWKKHLI